MATGYEDYILYMYTNQSLALSRLGNHLIGLMEMQSSARTGADWVTYDPSTLDKPIATAMQHWNYLNGVLYGIGQPRAIPTRRYDPGPSVGLGNNSNAGTGGNSSG
jgi:hypothetical protein